MTPLRRDPGPLSWQEVAAAPARRSPAPRPRLNPALLAGAAALHAAVLVALASFGAIPPPETPEDTIIEIVATPPALPEPPAPVAAPPPEPAAVTAAPTPAAPEPPPPEPPPPEPSPPIPPPKLPEPVPLEAAELPPPPPPMPRPRPVPPPPSRPQRQAVTQPAPRRATEPAPVTQLQSAPAAPAPAAMPPPAAAPAAINPGWQGELSAWLQSHKTYPQAARALGEEGVASVRFTVARSGRVVSAEIVRGTGSPILDAATADILRNAQLPAFPASMTQTEVTVTVSIRYRLDR